ncbi:hypothetical protein ACCT07_34650 [Rhizobium johnstonii]|uniref:hypothetical protein n=1 Tax=Rhizobium johnstonii TaxID=3019933 RepID=UPI003F96EE90
MDNVGIAVSRVEAYRANPAPARCSFGDKLRGILDERAKRALREHSCGETFLWSRLAPLETVSECSGPEFEFLNSDLDNLCFEIVQKSGELLSIIANSADGVGSTGDRYSIVPKSERISDWHSAETSKFIGRVNQMSDAVVAAANAFEREFQPFS